MTVLGESVVGGLGQLADDRAGRLDAGAARRVCQRRNAVHRSRCRTPAGVGSPHGAWGIVGRSRPECLRRDVAHRRDGLGRSAWGWARGRSGHFSCWPPAPSQAFTCVEMGLPVAIAIATLTLVVTILLWIRARLACGSGRFQPVPARDERFTPSGLACPLCPGRGTDCAFLRASDWCRTARAHRVRPHARRPRGSAQGSARGEVRALGHNAVPRGRARGVCHQPARAPADDARRRARRLRHELTAPPGTGHHGR